MITAKIYKIEYRNIIEKINKTKGWFIEKINKIDKTLSKLMGKKHKSQISGIKQDLIIDPATIKRIIRNYK